MKRILGSCLVLALVATAPACKKKKDDKAKSPAAQKVGSGSAPMPPPEAPAKDIDSKDILARTETSPVVHVKHVLLAWKDLEQRLGPRMDARAKTRTNDQAAQMAQDLAAKLKADPKQLDAIVKEHSEDPGSASGEPYEVAEAGRFVPEFKNLSLRLKMDEVGIVKTMFGYHVIQRVPPPPPDPLESKDILARTSDPGTSYVQHLMIGWKGAPGARGATRSKEDADKLVKEITDKLKAKGDMVALMKAHSDDVSTKDTGKLLDVTGKSPMPDPMKNLALRLKVGEYGVVKSPLGFHIMKRVPPPPPDPLESADILKRPVESQKTKVKHILLGWKDVNAGDPRGKERTRAALEKLVKETVAKLKKGDKIEPLMSELSEDPGSAKTGTSYDVTPDAGLVEPFKALGLRLKVNEVGVVKTNFGIHIIQRVADDAAPPAPPASPEAPPAPAGGAKPPGAASGSAAAPPPGKTP